MNKYQTRVALIILLIISIVSIAAYNPIEKHTPLENHTIFNKLNDTEKEFVLQTLAITAAGETIDINTYNPPSRNASLAILQELENAGYK
jgi:hypothetical protein